MELFEPACACGKRWTQPGIVGGAVLEWPSAKIRFEDCPSVKIGPLKNFLLYGMKHYATVRCMCPSEVSTRMMVNILVVHFNYTKFVLSPCYSVCVSIHSYKTTKFPVWQYVQYVPHLRELGDCDLE